MSITTASTLARFISSTSTPALAKCTRARSFAPREHLPCRVAVIGAGMSGATAARFLDAAGFSVTLLEARRRHGGRIHTVVDSGLPVELGASWIHGPLGNPISALAVATALETRRSTPAKTAYIYPNDASPSLPRDTLAGAQDELYFAAAAASAESRSEELSLRQWLDDHAHELGPGLRDPVGRAWATRTLALIEGEDAERLGMQQFAIQSPLEGGDRLVVGGYQTLVEELLDGMDIRYGSVVESITRGPSGAEIETSDGLYTADAVLVTVPLGVLKARAIRFDPPLSAARLDAVDALGFGTLDRIVLQYDDVFWPENAHFLGFPDWGGPVIFFLNHYAFDRSPTLTGFVVGSDARNLERDGEEQLIDAAIAPLVAHFGAAASVPARARATRWAHDPFSYGAYSYVPPNRTLDDYDTLARPEPGGLFFAGEATVRDHPATVHGAFYSGLRAAEEVARYCDEELS